MDLLLIQDIQPFLGILCLQDTVAVAHQVDFYQLRDLFFVVYNEDGCLCHIAPFRFRP